jgi:hypothetical protein
VALEEVARVAEDLAAAIDGQWEGIDGLVSIAVEGVRGTSPILAQPPRTGPGAE